MASIPEDVIRSIRDAVDIVDVVSRYVTLKRSGASHKGLCPFHEEKTPSFHVFPSSGRFKCFGCGEGGDAMAFLMKRGRLGFREVLEELSRETGIPLPAAAPGDAERAGRRASALEALAFAAAFFRKVLGTATGEPARAYLESRGFSPETIASFGVGYAPDEYEGLLGYARKKGLSDASLLEAGLVRKNEHGRMFDMFRGRIIFPIHDLRGRTIGFGARALGDVQPKYLNSPDSALFHKGREMYGLDLARSAAVDAGRLLVVEGYTDVMHCHQAGLRESAAALGTALTPENAVQMRRFGVPVLLVYDGDEAGRKAAERAAEVLLAERVEGAVALLPPGQDPADLVAQAGPEPLETALAGARDLFEYRLERAVERHGLDRLEARERVVRELAGPIGRIGDAIRRELAFKLLSERTGVPESTIRNEVRPESSPGRTRGGSPAAAPAAWVRAERDLIEAALGPDPVAWERVERVHPPAEFRDAGLGAVAAAIRDLRARGQSVNREALLGALADRDEAVDALMKLEPTEESRVRAETHLARLERDRRLASALEANDLEAVVRARRDSSTEMAG